MDASSDVPSGRLAVTPALLVAKALKVWVDERRTGFLILNFRNGELKYLEHQQREHLPTGQNLGDQPLCPSCKEPMAKRDGGMWACPACGVKRTEAQLRA